MGLSKRMRFEVLRRDGHKCRYCGATAHDAKLTVDHVIPAALGGRDELSNLVAACTDCNAGKASVPPDAPLVADVGRGALRWNLALVDAARMRREQQAVIDLQVQRFDEAWSGWTYVEGDAGRVVARPTDWKSTIERFLSLGLTVDAMRRFIEVAMTNKRVVTSECWPYFCGCCWREISALQDAARSILQAEEDAHGSN